MTEPTVAGFLAGVLIPGEASMARRFLRGLLGAALASLTACGSSDHSAAHPDPGPNDPDAWVCIATYGNPRVFEDGARADNALQSALRAAGIESVSAGSRGFSLNVARRNELRARQIVRDVIERDELVAELHSWTE